ncbi:hypothetical protein EU527_12960 [Candidatus Thorarchaeota archaeon]|nr:MAG: hypothetical protein EU527_12960 [Candidatus Thorarchaeota archaeon]
MELTKFLKISFIIDGLVATIYGLILLLLPDMHATLTGFPLEEFADRFSGALMLGYGIGNIFAYRGQSWESVELVVIMNISFLIPGIIVGIYCMAIALIPIGAIFQVGLMAFLLILFLYSYYEIKMK